MSKLEENKQHIVFSIDVEAVGLYREGFAVGVSVRGDDNKEIDSLCLIADYKSSIDYANSDCTWLESNVIPILEPPNCVSIREMRNQFWKFYISYRSNPAYTIEYVADCGSPVEANFFRQCVLDNEEERRWLAPYPLHELGTLLLVNNEDPTGYHGRDWDEMPPHNPLHDARQSGRLWIEFKKALTK
jgi:hypothetical protein